MSINTLIVDPEGVLFTRSDNQKHLKVYLNSIGLEPRHPQIVEKALKAARFDVLHGRITRQTYYNAILRLHGVPEDMEFAIGRKALIQDSANVIPIAGIANVLQQVYASGISLGLVVNSEHSAAEFIHILGEIGYLKSIWSYAISSSEAGAMIPDPAIFRPIIESPADTAILSTRSIPWIKETGIQALTYQARTPIHGVQNIHSPQDLISALVS